MIIVEQKYLMMGTALTQKKRVITVNLINKQGGIMTGDLWDYCQQAITKAEGE